MGMTIDFATEILKQYKDKPTLINEIETVEEAVWLDDSLETALDIMRKYQKIQQIIKEWRNSGLLRNQLYEMIREVVGDGNNN